jgi:hypothetical protein
MEGQHGQFQNAMEAAWCACKEAVLAGKSLDCEKFPVGSETLAVGKRVTQRCRNAYTTAEDARESNDVSDEHLTRLTRFTDGLPLLNYAKMFGMVPELVNVVTVKLA